MATSDGGGNARIKTVGYNYATNTDKEVIDSATINSKIEQTNKLINEINNSAHLSTDEIAKQLNYIAEMNPGQVRRLFDYRWNNHGDYTNRQTLTSGTDLLIFFKIPGLYKSSTEGNYLDHYIKQSTNYATKASVSEDFNNSNIFSLLLLVEGLRKTDDSFDTTVNLFDSAGTQIDSDKYLEYDYVTANVFTIEFLTFHINFTQLDPNDTYYLKLYVHMDSGNNPLIYYTAVQGYLV